MFRALATGSLVAALALAAVPAASAALTPTEKKLTAEVAALQKDVKTLKKQVKDAQGLAIAGLQVGFCNTAITADTFQGTWAVIDQIAQATQAGKTYFGPQLPVNDSNLCQQALSIARSVRIPPTTTPFAQILALLTGGQKYAARSMEALQGLR